MQVVVRSIVIALALAFAGNAHAGPLSKPTNLDAREHLERGNRLFEVGSFDAAIEEYKAGALIENAPLFLHNIALAYRMAGKRKESIFFYDQFKRRAKPTGEMLAEIDRLIDQMKSELEERSKTMPPTEPAPSTRGSEGVQSSQGSGHGVAPQGSVTTTAARVASSPDWFAIGMISAGSVGVLVGGGLLWDAHSLRGDADATTNQIQRDALYQKADTRTLIGGIVGGVGVAVLATGVIKLAVGHGGAGAPAASAALSIGASPTSVFVFGRF